MLLLDLLLVGSRATCNKWNPDIGTACVPLRWTLLARFNPMALYYFALAESGLRYAEDGEELPDVAAAHEWAEQVARELAKNNDASRGSVKVFNAAKELI